MKRQDSAPNARTQTVWEAFVTLYFVEGAPPTVADIVRATGWSRSTVHHHLMALVSQGLLTHKKGKWGAFRLSALDITAKTVNPPPRNVPGTFTARLYVGPTDVARLRRFLTTPEGCRLEVLEVLDMTTMRIGGPGAELLGDGDTEEVEDVPAGVLPGEAQD